MFKPIGVPTVVVSHSVIQVNESDTVTLECIVNGTPAVTDVRWYQLGGASLIKSTSAESPDLYFDNVQLSNAGNYTCSAKNAVGWANSSTSIMLEVTEGIFFVALDGFYLFCLYLNF